MRGGVFTGCGGASPTRRRFGFGCGVAVASPAAPTSTSSSSDMVAQPAVTFLDIISLFCSVRPLVRKEVLFCSVQGDAGIATLGPHVTPAGCDHHKP